MPSKVARSSRGVPLEQALRSRRSSHYPIPWSALVYKKDLDGYQTKVTERQLKDAPAFSDDSWTDRNWETRVHQHYGAPTYW